MAYQVLSPDNIAIAPKTYSTLQNAKRALAKWVQNYSSQGFYSQVCWNGYRRQIPLSDLPDYCEIIEI